MMKQIGIKSGFKYRRRLYHRHVMGRCPRVTWCFNSRRKLSVLIRQSRSLATSFTTPHCNTSKREFLGRCITLHQPCLPNADITTFPAIPCDDGYRAFVLKCPNDLFMCRSRTSLLLFVFLGVRGVGFFFNVLDATSPQRRPASIHRVIQTDFFKIMLRTLMSM